MRLAVAALALLVPALADADDRSTVVTIGGAVGVHGNVDAVAPDGIGDARLRLGWEHDQLPIPPEEGKYNVGGALVPELVAGSFFEKDRAEGYLGVGVRAELLMAQNAMGLLKITSRGAGYLSARALVVGGSHDVTWDFGLGQYFSRLANRTRFGYEIEFLNRQHFQQTDAHYVGFLFSLYVGWAP